MSQHDDIVVVDRDGVAVAECPRCGDMVELFRGAHDCDEELPFDGVCPMCEEPYESYLDHLKECDGGE